MMILMKNVVLHHIAKVSHLLQEKHYFYCLHRYQIKKFQDKQMSPKLSH